MQFQFVNHASGIFSFDSINLEADPWLEVRALQDRWFLLSEKDLKLFSYCVNAAYPLNHKNLTISAAVMHAYVTRIWLKN